ncbi:MAG: glutamate--tRNA ligase family protein [Vicinamibacterales bacterium]
MILAPGRVDGPGLAAWLADRTNSPLTRFAPAPTGGLHLGHVVNALFVWGLAGALGGRVVLRVEDHDRQRARRAYEVGLLDDLDWLGLEPDAYPTEAFRAGECDSRQSDREPVYRAALAPLIEAGLVYGCACSRRDIEARAAARPRPTEAEEPGELWYPGTCRDRGLPLTGDVGWRLRLPGGDVRFEDALCGKVVQVPAEQCGDVLIRDRLGNWTYQWAVSVDDLRQDITLVVRGTDLLASTGRQIQIAALLGRPRPATFVHHPLLLKTPTRKLSKSDGDSGIAELRAAGWLPERVLGEAAFLVGLAPAGRRLHAADLPGLFATSVPPPSPLS